MSTIDIRDELDEVKEANRIIFGENKCKLNVRLYNSGVIIADALDYYNYTYQRDEDIPNLIKALEKVCELKGIEK